MLVGMSLARHGFFTGAWRRSSYTRLAIAGCAAGWAGAALTLWLDRPAHHDVLRSTFFWSLLDIISQPFAALGYAAAILGLVRGRSKWLWPLAAVGRTALSGYLLQSILCATLFYGHGLGWFGRVDRIGQMKIVVSIWLLLLVVAPLWLRVFRFGPVEWVWRSSTYGAWQPMWRSTHDRAEDGPALNDVGRETIA